MPRDYSMQNDTVDVADLARTLRRQWRAVISFLVLGVAAGAAIMVFAPKRYGLPVQYFVTSVFTGAVARNRRVAATGWSRPHVTRFPLAAASANSMNV